ncbi:MAG: MarR family transcriptional regulator [Paludibacter sp.]|jgi:MarR family transcriptional regulator for hemolysin|nr:MarR family transcriptional regulator [Paludibacter sp.]
MEIVKMPLGMVVIKMLKPMFCVLEMRAAKQTDLKLTMPQFVLLFTINEEKEEVILKDMAEKLGKDKSAILRMIDLLEKKELVRRVVDQNDRRKNQLMVTKKGERLIAEFRKIESELNSELLEGLSEADMETFYKVANHIQIKSEQLKIASTI